MEQTSSTIKKILICGHRNPDVDSIMAAYALADLKRNLGDMRVEPVCPGLMPHRAAWLFKRFRLPLPLSKNDVYLRIGDIATPAFISISADTTLFEAVQRLKSTGMTGLPVVDAQNTLIGMLSPMALLSELMNITSHKDQSLAGRAVYSSVALMTSVLAAELLSGTVEDDRKVFNVFVAAMSVQAFEKRLLKPDRENPVIITGDRPEIHHCVITHRLPVLIITGDCDVEDNIIRLAAENNVTILRTHYDSATVIRRLKFSTPVCNVPLSTTDSPLRTTDIVHDVRREILSSPDNIFPVCDADNKLVGVVSKTDFTSPPPFAMILVDHNETAQGIAGLDELPILEVVDHHRIAIRPTVEPIKYTADVVGSTCTIIAGMYRTAGLRPSRKIAGILLSGIVTDTLLFQSPTTTDTDRRIADWLEKISGDKSALIMHELMQLDSPLAVMSMEEAINSDRKTYTENGYAFALSQIEENNLELFHRNRTELLSALEKILSAESLDFMALMVTDPVRGNSELLFFGTEAVRRAIPYRKRPDGILSLPGVLSRKKQLLPQIIAALATLPKNRSNS